MATEKRLIDATPLMKNGWHLERTGNSNRVLESMSLADVPTVDAVEVVHGHWCWEGEFKACSQCGSYVEWTETLGTSFWKFCPYCGAKMDGDGNGNL